MKYVIAAILTPIAFILNYFLWVCIIGVVVSFLTWDWTIIPNNIFPWQEGEINIWVRAIAGAFGILGMVVPWAMIEAGKNEPNV